MSIEELLVKLENDLAEADRVRNESYEKCRALTSEMKIIFKWERDLDDFDQRFEDLRFRLENARYDERMACSKVNRIITTIDEIKLRIGQV